MKWGREKCFKMAEGNDGAQREDGFSATQDQRSIGGERSREGETLRETWLVGGGRGCFFFFG